jgi:CHAT domain-containing protein
MASRHHAASIGEGPEAAALAQALSAARKRLSALVVRGPNSQAAEDYSMEMAKAEEDKERAERNLAEKSVAFREELAGFRRGLPEVAAALSPNSALVAYVEYKQSPKLPLARTGSSLPTPVRSYLALILRPGLPRPILIPLGPATRIETLIRDWKSALTAEPMGLSRSGSRAEARYRDMGSRLRKAVWDPLVGSLGKASIVFIVPDGALSLVSLAALPTGKSAYLVESGPLMHYLSTERDLAPGPSERPAGKGLLVMGGPDFDALRAESVPGEEVTLAESTGGTGSEGRDERQLYRNPSGTCEDLQTIRFSPLPGAAEEASDIQSLWIRTSGEGNGSREIATKLIGPDATETSFKRRASGYRVLHLATHGFFLESHCPSTLHNARSSAGERFHGGREAPAILGENPLLLSGLALAGANRRQAFVPEAEDGMLTAEEITSLNLSGVEWAVLSACETGVGQVMAGEGVLGLRRAFKVAGAKTLIMSLWKVGDETSREWMRNLYEGRRRGLPTAQAVRNASLEMIQSRRSRNQSTHPFFWGAFVAAGDWR